MADPILPTYYVRHPDGSYSIAEPQPPQEQIAKQRNVYAQCDQKHGGSCCEDPYCWRVGNPERADDSGVNVGQGGGDAQG